MVPFILYSKTLLTRRPSLKKQNLLLRSALLSLLLNCAFALSGCQPNPQNSQAQNSEPKKNGVRVTFSPHFQGKPIACGQTLKINNQQWRASEFAMFLSQFSLNSDMVVILDDNDWQSQQIALIRAAVDCEPSTGNMSVVGHVQNKLDADGKMRSIETLSFTVGVPFALNHQNPLLQASPLNDSSMFWAWRNGYKFMRWDMQSNDGDAWSFHLGSVGCESASMVRAPAQDCAQPNRIAVTLAVDAAAMGGKALSSNASSSNALSSNKTMTTLTVAINIDEILGKLAPTRENTCMFSSIDNTTCQTLVENLNSRAVFQ